MSRSRYETAQPKKRWSLCRPPVVLRTHTLTIRPYGSVEKCIKCGGSHMSKTYKEERWGGSATDPVKVYEIFWHKCSECGYIDHSHAGKDMKDTTELNYTHEGYYYI